MFSVDNHDPVSSDTIKLYNIEIGNPNIIGLFSSHETVSNDFFLVT